jgi:hypothetical protein
MAHPARFELTTSASGGQRSIQLSYGCFVWSGDSNEIGNFFQSYLSLSFYHHGIIRKLYSSGVKYAGLALTVLEVNTGIYLPTSRNQWSWLVCAKIGLVNTICFKCKCLLSINAFIFNVLFSTQVGSSKTQLSSLVPALTLQNGTSLKVPFVR